MNNKEKLIADLRENGYALANANVEFINDLDVVRTAVNTDGLALKHASPELRNNNIEIVLTAVKRNGYALEHAGPKLRNNIEIVVTAIKDIAGAFKFASEEIQLEEKIKNISNIKNREDRAEACEKYLFEHRSKSVKGSLHCSTSHSPG